MLLLGSRKAAGPLAQPPVRGQVWANTTSGVYHCPTSAAWANLKSGRLMTEDAALTAGYRPARGRGCGLTGGGGAGAQPLQMVVAPTVADTIRVWVNTRSGVYHCPGTRYYGSTKAGRFIGQAAARSAGYRAAGGNPCG